jgi:hypothetical protein
MENIQDVHHELDFFSFSHGGYACHALEGEERLGETMMMVVIYSLLRHAFVLVVRKRQSQVRIVVLCVRVHILNFDLKMKAWVYGFVTSRGLAHDASHMPSPPPALGVLPSEDLKFHTILLTFFHFFLTKHLFFFWRDGADILLESKKIFSAQLTLATGCAVSALTGRMR